MPDPSDSAIRELAAQILARREFAPANDDSRLAWLDWLRRFLTWVETLRVDSPILYWMLLAALAIAALAAIAQVVWALRAALSAPPPPSRRQSFPGQPPDLAAQAQELAAGGHFLEAAHRLMLASFGVLAESAVIELRPDRSNRWIRAALRGSTLAEGFAIEIGAAVERTEQRWFGNRENQPDVYFHWRSIYQQLMSAER